VFVDASGNVGFGITPNAYSNNSRLTLQGTGLNNTIYSNFNGTGNDKHILLTNGGSALCYIGTNNTSLTFGTGGTEYMRLTSAGLLGLGTSAPWSKLAIGSGGTANPAADVTIHDSNASTYRLKLTSTVFNSNGNWLGLGFGYSDNYMKAGILAECKDGNGLANLHFCLNNTANNSNASLSDSRMVVTSGGNVGIGTTGPSSRLEVGGESQPRISINSTGAGTTGLLFQGAGTTYGSIIENISTGELAIKAGASGQNSYFITFGTNDGTEYMRLDSSGRLLVGLSTASVFTYGGITPRLQVEGTDGSTGALSIARNSNDANAPGLILSKSRGTTAGSNTIVQNNDTVGDLRFEAADGTQKVIAASISAAVDGTPGANDMPGRLVFATTADGAASPTEAMRIKSTQIINFSNAPTYADNTAATAGGLAVGDVYKTVLGVLMIRF
jgi:hypothetical protein